MLGYLITDGNAANSISKNRPLTFTNSNINYLKRVEELVNNQFPDIRVNWYKKPEIIKKDGKENQKEAYDLQFFHKDGMGNRGQNSLKEFLRAMNFHPCGFPRSVAEHFTKEQVCAFIRGAYAGDGSWEIQAKSGTYRGIFSCGLNLTYTEYFQALFNKLGIKSKFTEWTGKLSTGIFYSLRINGKNELLKFNNIVGDILDKSINNVYSALRKKYALVDKFKNKKIINYDDGEKFILSKVKSINIEKEKLVNCYDVEYPNKGWFTVRGIRVFNSGKTEVLALGSLFLALCRPIQYGIRRRYKDATLIGTEKPDGTINETGWTETIDPYMRGAKIIVGSADADKARTIFDRVMKFVSASEKLSAGMDEGTIIKKLHPFPELIFNVAGWTEPASITFRGPGASGQTARSKTFDYKLYDEADYMPPIFFEAEKATSINAGDHGLVILSSTPTGKREHFYNACFTEDAPVIMADGSLKKIIDIKIGDMVFNRYGKPEPVTKIMNREMNSFRSKSRRAGSLVTVMTSLNDTAISVTSNHNFMAVLKYERFCQSCLKFVWKNNTDCVLHGKHKGLKPLQPQYHHIDKLSVGDYLAIPLSLIKAPKKVFLGHIEGEFLYVPITQYKKEYTKAKVYNLTVGDDHSYCVNYYGVANCTRPDWNYQEFHVPSKENPNYTPEFDREFLAEHTKTVYEHEIEAIWGTAEEGVFDWTFFEWVFRPYYEKKSLNSNEVVQVPIYRIFDTDNNKKRKPYPDEYERINLNPSNLKKIGFKNLAPWLISKLPPKMTNKRYWFGADLGYQSDPSEFVVFEEYNGILKLILRIHMEHIEYLTQVDIIAFLDTFYQFAALGMDQGSNGLMVEQVLKAKENGHNKYKAHNFEKRLHAINFSKTVQVSNKFNGQTVLVPVKQFMTDSIIMAAQSKMLILPGVDVDEDIENQFRNHTYSVGSGGTIIYSKGSVSPDHIIDAVRTAFFAKSMAKMPSNKAWPTGNTFKPNGGSRGWR